MGPFVLFFQLITVFVSEQMKMPLIVKNKIQSTFLKMSRYFISVPIRTNETKTLNSKTRSHFLSFLFSLSLPHPLFHSFQLNLISCSYFMRCPIYILQQISHSSCCCFVHIVDKVFRKKYKKTFLVATNAEREKFQFNELK